MLEVLHRHASDFDPLQGGVDSHGYQKLLTPSEVLESVRVGIYYIRLRFCTAVAVAVAVAVVTCIVHYVSFFCSVFVYAITLYLPHARNSR